MLWLIVINQTDLYVCLLSLKDKTYSLLSIGPRQSWTDLDSLITGTDQSLSQAAQAASLSPQQEPEKVAFVLPPFWTGSDNQILTDKTKLIKKLCQKLDLSPVGFINDDESILEQQQRQEAFPASFILLHLNSDHFTLSLVYLGKIKTRLKRDYNSFSVDLLYQSLIDLNIDSALPPQIIIFGDYTDSQVKQVKDYSWTGRQDSELFLHIPEVKTYSQQDLVGFYAQMISSQIKQVDDQALESESESELKPKSDSDSVVEIEPGELGFGQSDSPPSLPSVPTPIVKKPKPKLKLPQIKIKKPAFKLKLNLTKNFLYLLALAPLLLLIPFLFSSAQITLFLTPINFDQTIPVTLSTQKETSQSTSTVKVNSQQLSVSSSSSVATTGQKTTGEKATGSITVYNKLEESQILSSGTILQDQSGKKFEIINSVTVPASTSNLEEGIITLGQVKTVISALDFGPEYNIDQDQSLSFEDFASSSLIAKTNQALSGGSRRVVSVVAQDDKYALKSKVEDQLSLAVTQKVEKDFQNLTGLIDQSVQIQTSRIEYNREIGEETDSLTATIDAQVLAFFLTPDQKQQIIDVFLKNSPDFDQAKINSADFSINFDIDNKRVNQASGLMTISGSSLPKLDLIALKKQVSGQLPSRLLPIIKSFNSRIYDYQLSTNFSFLSAINPIPFNFKNIDIILESASHL